MYVIVAKFINFKTFCQSQNQSMKSLLKSIQNLSQYEKLLLE